MSTVTTTAAPSAPPAWKFWFRFLLYPVVTFSVGAVLASGVLAGQWGWQAVCILAVGCSAYCVAGSFHETVHQTLFQSERANVLYGRAAGILVFIPYTAFRETHRTHHAYLNTARDLEMWPYSDPSQPRWFRRAFVLFELCCGWIASPLIFSRIYFVHPDRLTAQARAKIGREYLVMALFWGVVATAVGWLIATGRLEWTVVVAAYVLPSIIAPGINAVRKFIEHLGLPSTDPVLGTRTVLGPGLLTRLCSYFNFDIAIHGPHHRYPRARHYELPQRLQQLQAQAEPGREPPVFPTFLAALRDTLPCLWRCPAVGETVHRDLGQNDSPGGGPGRDDQSTPLQPEEWDRMAAAG